MFRFQLKSHFINIVRSYISSKYGDRGENTNVDFFFLHFSNCKPANHGLIHNKMHLKKGFSFIIIKSCTSNKIQIYYFVLRKGPKKYL